MVTDEAGETSEDHEEHCFNKINENSYKLDWTVSRK